MHLLNMCTWKYIKVPLFEVYIYVLSHFQIQSVAVLYIPSLGANPSMS
jgi:hypothetical protein